METGLIRSEISENLSEIISILISYSPIPELQ